MPGCTLVKQAGYVGVRLVHFYLNFVLFFPHLLDWHLSRLLLSKIHLAVINKICEMQLKECIKRKCGHSHLQFNIAISKSLCNPTMYSTRLSKTSSGVTKTILNKELNITEPVVLPRKKTDMGTGKN